MKDDYPNSYYFSFPQAKGKDIVTEDQLKYSE